MSGLPDDVTPAMLHSKTVVCVVCEGPTTDVCENCDASVCDTDACEEEHLEQTGHGVSRGS